MHKNPQSILDVSSVNTNVFVLIGHFPLILKSSTLLRKKTKRISIRESYMSLGSKRAQAFIGCMLTREQATLLHLLAKVYQAISKHFCKLMMLSCSHLLHVDLLMSYQIGYLAKWSGSYVYRTGDISECAVRGIR